MGRSVDYLNNALRVAYVSYEDTYEDEDYKGLAERWVDKNWGRVEELVGANLRKVGRFSNGECVYERV